MRNTEDLLTTAEVSRLLGITVAWVNKQAATGRLPVAHKLPGLTGAYLFRREDIAAQVTARELADTA